MSMYQPPSLSIRLLHTSLGHNVDIEGGVNQAKLSGKWKGEGLAILDYQGVVYCWKSDRRMLENNRIKQRECIHTSFLYLV